MGTTVHSISFPLAGYFQPNSNFPVLISEELTFSFVSEAVFVPTRNSHLHGHQFNPTSIKRLVVLGRH